MKAGNLTIKWHHRPAQTGCSLKNEKTGEVVYGTALCHAKDHFCKDTGRKLSLARALKKADIPKAERTVIWELYRNMKPNKRW